MMGEEMPPASSFFQRTFSPVSGSQMVDQAGFAGDAVLLRAAPVGPIHRIGRRRRASDIRRFRFSWIAFQPAWFQSASFQPAWFRQAWFQPAWFQPAWFQPASSRRRWFPPVSLRWLAAGGVASVGFVAGLGALSLVGANGQRLGLTVGGCAGSDWSLAGRMRCGVRAARRGGLGNLFGRLFGVLAAAGNAEHQQQTANGKNGREARSHGLLAPGGFRTIRRERWE